MVNLGQAVQEKIILNIVNRAFLNDREIIKCFSKIRDFGSELYTHSLNVGLLSLAVGMRAGKKALELEEIFIAGLLHDFGKLYIPKDVLCKNGQLSTEEKNIIELHPSAGFLCLKRNTNLPDRITYAVLDHHEKEDGSGYASRKNGSNISEYAKIIAPADIYEAMVSDRVYRKAIDRKIVMDHLSLCAGRSLNYDYVSLFIEFLNNNNIDEFLNIYTVIVTNLHDDYLKTSEGEDAKYHII